MGRLGCAVLAGVTLLLVACHGKSEADAQAARVFNAPSVIVAARDVPVLYTTTGSVESDERVEISSRTAAYVRTIEVREGQRVYQKQLLATLDNHDVEAAILAARASRDQAKAAVLDTEKDVEINTRLFARDGVSETQLRKLRLARQMATENLAAAEAALALAVSERQYTNILSPVAGIVVARHQRTGDLASPGVPLITVESDTALLFDTHVAEQRVAAISTGDEVELSIDALGKTLSGEVVRIVSSGNPTTRDFQIKVSIPDTPGLLPGMFGRARFRLSTQKAVVVPNDALVDRGGLSGVYVVGTDNSLRFRWLRTERKIADGWVVLAGLDPGERIVAHPTSMMREGDRVAAAGPAK